MHNSSESIPSTDTLVEGSYKPDMSDPAGSLSMDSSGDSKHVEYLQRLEVPTTERMEEIAEKQERNEEVSGAAPAPIQVRAIWGSDPDSTMLPDCCAK
jgi:hypothetical protein